MNDGLSLPDNRRSPVLCLHGQHPPLQRVYSSATFEQLLTQVCQTWPQYTRNLRQPKTWPES
ncbi:hypothetical protein ACSLOD_28045, partial [Escherichia coli]